MGESREAKSTSREREKVLVDGAVAMIKRGRAAGVPVKDMLACFDGKIHGVIALELVLRGIV